ncbi:hypothetical protein CNR22_12510 [Sphingobacteriaceae bacterium]|nr:hypothetical protein CNR22_12510 [Sphingobacteriaceae bacterium]
MDIFDLILPPLYLILVLYFAHKFTLKRIRKEPIYKYFMRGLLLKIFGAICLGLVYFFYYTGGDTVNYHYTASALITLLFERPYDFMYIYFDEPLVSEFYLMNSNYDFTYWVNDSYAFFVSKCFVPVILLCGKSYMASAIVIASLCYLGVWRLFLVFVREFPHLEKQLTWSVLYVPSVIFWGSGIMKDSVTFSATCFYVHGFYWFFTQRRWRIKYLVSLIMGVYFLLSIKPYILFALLPGSILWFVSLRVTRIKNNFVRIMITPTLLALGIGIALYTLEQLGDSLGVYSLEKVIKTASGAQQDLKQSYYGGNTFNIGDYEPTVAGMLSVAHKAIFATLFRPTLIDVRNFVMGVCAIENTFILVFTVYLIIRLRVFRFFSLITSHPLLMFSFIFSIFFAFSVGVSISNFGTLVRLKIPCIPFYLSSLVILNSMVESKIQQKVKRIKMLPT